jgi:hypothetical protein
MMSKTRHLPKPWSGPRERAKADYIHREVASNALSNAFDAGFEAVMEFYTSEEI